MSSIHLTVREPAAIEFDQLPAIVAGYPMPKDRTISEADRNRRSAAAIGSAELLKRVRIYIANGGKA